MCGIAAYKHDNLQVIVPLLDEIASDPPPPNNVSYTQIGGINLVLDPLVFRNKSAKQSNIPLSKSELQAIHG